VCVCVCKGECTGDTKAKKWKRGTKKYLLFHVGYAVGLDVRNHCGLGRECGGGADRGVLDVAIGIIVEQCSDRRRTGAGGVVETLVSGEATEEYFG